MTTFRPRCPLAIVPAGHPGVAHLDDWDGIGRRLTRSGTTVFDRVPVADHGELGHYKEDLRSLNSFVQLVHPSNLTGIARSFVVGTAAVVQGRSRTSLHALSDKATQDPDVLGVVGRLCAYRFTADAVLRKVSEALESAETADTPEDLRPGIHRDLGCPGRAHRHRSGGSEPGLPRWPRTTPSSTSPA